MFRRAELTGTANRARRAAPAPPYPVMDALLDCVHSLRRLYALLLPWIFYGRGVACELSAPGWSYKQTC